MPHRTLAKFRNEPGGKNPRIASATANGRTLLLGIGNLKHEVVFADESIEQ